MAIALTNLQIFNDQVRTSFVEELDQRIDLFNAATKGAITLASGNSAGDFTQDSLYQRISGLVDRRDPTDYTTSVTSLEIVELLHNTVKVGARALPVSVPPGLFDWVGSDPVAAGVRVGSQAAEDALADILNTSIGACVSALLQEGTNVYDYSGTGTLTFGALINGARTMGDAYDKVVCTIMHSKSWFDLMGANLTNSANLFTYGTVQVKSDPLGRPIIISDSASLIKTADTPDSYYSLGLVAGGIGVVRNNDFRSSLVEVTGKPNIIATLQSQWSFNLGMKGFYYNSTRGPTTAALTTGTNWTKIATSNKDLPGTLVKSQ
jgi:hypothetical protein